MGSSSQMGAKAPLAIAAVVAAVLGMAALAAFFASRDDATVRQESDGPGVPRGANARPQVRPGNVVLLYSDERLTSDLRGLAADIAGEPGPTLEAAGQAVLVQRRPNLSAPVTALTATRRLQASGPKDPALRTFAEFWLGRAR